MKLVFTSIIFVLAVISCGSRINPDDLPKDIALKPEKPKISDSTATEKDFDAGLPKKMQELRDEIEELVSSVSCDDASQWRISPLGSKPCGGPARYIAYPKSKEKEILPKIKTYTELQTAYNKTNNLVSDCAVVLPPSGIKCENGNAVLYRNSGTENPENH
ncbi:MAG: hypothetical protein QM564_10875 [Bergeyella sp.]